MSSEAYHEPFERLSDESKDMHRALLSLMEELEAIDWYQQRADVCTDDALRRVLLHNKNEEIEHAMMTLEWIRRTSREFDESVRTYVLSQGEITELEVEAKAEGAPAAEASAPATGSLGIGSLRALRSSSEPARER